MNIEFMRKVDYWVGVPLTTLLTAWCWLDGAIRRRPALEDVRRVLFIELSEMGTAIIADPVLRRVGQRSELFFLIFRRNAASLHIYNTIPEANIFTIRDHAFHAFLWDTLRFIRWCRRNRIQAVIDLELFSRATAILSAVSGASIRLGFFNPNSEGLYRGGILTHPVAYNPHRHIAENFVSLCDPLAQHQHYKDAHNRRRIEESEVQPGKVQPTASAIARVEKELRRRVPALTRTLRILLVNINAGDFLPQRKWPKPHFVEFVRMFLARNAAAHVLLTGSQDERQSVEEVVAAVNCSRCINIAGNLEFEDLPALYAIAAAMLTNDSGPAHFASAVGLRTYVLFGPETPDLYGPRINSIPIYARLACSPCVTAANHRNTPCRDNRCLQVIEPAFVLGQIQDYFDRQQLRAAAD